MKTKKIVIAVLVTALLLSAMLIVGCMEQLDDLSGKEKDSYQIPTGKGIIRLTISDSNARTIFPNTSGFGSMLFTIEYNDRTPTGTGGDHSDSQTKVSMADASDPFVLEPDTYDISITAYDSTGTTPIAAWDSTLDSAYSSGITVNTTSVGVTANLVGITTGTDKGNFTYSITYNALPAVSATQLTALSYTSQVLDLKPYGGSVSVSGFPVTTLTAGSANTPLSFFNINPGFYVATVTLQASNCQDRVVEEIIHIYPTLTTTYTDTIPVPNQDTFTANFDLNGKADSTFGTSPKSIYPIANATTIANTSIGTPAVTSFNFIGWYTTNNGTNSTPPTGTEFVPGSTRVFKDMTLYAYWTDVGSQGVTLNITFTCSDPMTFAPTGGSASSYNDFQTGTGATSYKEFTLSNAVDYTNLVWKFDGIDVTTEVVNGTTDDVLTITKTFSQFTELAVTGPHYLIVSGELNGKPFSKSVTIVVTN